MFGPRTLFLAAVVLVAVPATRASAQAAARIYVDAIKTINAEHAKKPGAGREEDLAKRLGSEPKAVLEKLLAAKPSPETAAALLDCGNAAADLDLQADFDAIRKRLLATAPEAAEKLGRMHSTKRFILRLAGAFADDYPTHFAAVATAVLEAYDAVFGFTEFSKVAGKKLRFFVHLEKSITRPPHFAPQFPFHSEIDFPVVDPAALKSPTADGKFLFYGLCHELGHVVAMWGDRTNEEDRHAWAHFTGVVVVQYMSEKMSDRPFMKELRDARWRSVDLEKKEIAQKKILPGRKDAAAVGALLIALADLVGTKAIGAAINRLDKEDRRLRINGVRYYGFRDFETALLAVVEKAKAKPLQDLFAAP